MNVIDSHLHVWDLSGGGYSWLGPQHGPLHRSFLPDEAARALDGAGVGAAVLVQAEDSVADSRYLLGVAEACEWVAGVVGWVSIDDAETAERQLGDYGAHPLFRGTRQLVHDDPRGGVLMLPEVHASLQLVAERGLPFDVPDAWPRDLRDVIALADALPQLTVVVDHLGKPPRGAAGMADWGATLREVAARPNTVAKVSGLGVAGQPFTPDDLRPVLDVALDAFGAPRLMYGGDWPMTVPAGGYLGVWRVLSTLIGELSPTEQEHLLHRTATSVYGLSVGAGGAR
jgi:L-fuconolactonase